MPSGRVAERLGRALQKLVQQFESARDLIKTHQKVCFFYLQQFVPIAIGTARDLKTHQSVCFFILNGPYKKNSVQGITSSIED
jgi:hypothetical protein